MKQFFIKIVVVSIGFITMSAEAEWQNHPIPVQYDPTPPPAAPAAKPAETDAAKTTATIKSTEPELTQMSPSDFFENVQTCTGTGMMQMQVMSGKLYGSNNNVCHFSIHLNKTSPETSAQTIDCYVPVDDLLTTFIDINTEPADETSVNNNNANESVDDTPPAGFNGVPAAEQFLTGLGQLQQFCTTQTASNQLPNLKKQFDETKTDKQ